MPPTSDWSREFDAHAAFMRLYGCWRKKDGYKLALDAYCEFIAKCGPNAERQADKMQRAAESRIRRWKDDGQAVKFDKRLDVWISGDLYLDEEAYMNAPEAPAEDAATAMLRRIGL